MYYVAVIAVTVSPLSLPQRRSDPHSSSYLRVRVLFFPPFPSRNFPKLVNCCAGNMKGDSLTFFFFMSTNWKVHVKKD